MSLSVAQNGVGRLGGILPFACAEVGTRETTQAGEFSSLLSRPATVADGLEVRSSFADIVRAIVVQIGAATISESGLHGQPLIQGKAQGSFNEIRRFGSPTAHCRNQTSVASRFGNQGHILALLGETTCRRDRFTSFFEPGDD